MTDWAKVAALGKKLERLEVPLKFCDQHRGSNLKLTLESRRLMGPQTFEWPVVHDSVRTQIMQLVQGYFEGQRDEVRAEIEKLMKDNVDE